jgi:alcohol dehydrogenase class IV
LPATIRTFASPARIRCASGASALAGAELRALGARPSHGSVAVVGDQAVLDLGLAGAAVSGLREAGFTVDVRPGVGAEPTPETVRALLPEDRGEPVAAVVAMGGGSALDAAKLMGLSIAEDVDLTTGLLADAEVSPGPPLLAIPTTAGTGAEATAVAMLWHDGRKRMFVNGVLVPRAALLDSDLLVGLPAAVTAAGGLDAISHAVESMLSTFRTPLTEAAATSALSLLAEALPAAYETGDPRAREKTLLGAYQAGLALNASVVLGHSLAYVIAAEAGLPHGVSCAMALPYCLAHARRSSEGTIARIARIVCADDEADGHRLLAWLVEANDTMGIPGSLEAVGIDSGSLDRLAEICVESYPRPNHPSPIDTAGVRALLDDFYAGEPMLSWERTGSAV